MEREGTAILSKMVAGQTIDTMGPQGNGFDISVIEAGQKALLVGGGIGVPPLVETAKQLKAKGVEVVSVIGLPIRMLSSWRINSELVVKST